MKKTIGALIDELGITNIKIFHLVDKVQRDKRTKKDAKELQDLKRFSSELVNAINEYFDERRNIKERMISIFWPKKHGGYLSTEIRGYQMAKFLGARINPKKKYKNDVCIYLKPSNLDDIEDGDWVDVLDGGKFIKKLKKRPGINLIAASKRSYDWLKNHLANKVVLIPHHHLNWEGQRRERKEVNTCGYTGSVSPIAREIYGRIGRAVKEIGFDFVTCFKFEGREDAANFYKNIDILVIGGWELGDQSIHKTPTKIINAASFGVPTVAYPLKSYKEIEGYYLPANNMKELLAGVKKLKAEYDQWPEKLIKMAEPYHIENVVKLYQKLT
ncbi:MAG TPA: hypothetical protein VMY36_00895 [Patescibacteria group bacterium]|nr:hypothetical protein [Patescibacteria group bacterium]